MPDGELFCFYINRVFSWHVLMGAHVSIDVDGSGMLLTASNTPAVLAVVVSRW